jgi:alcohol dehydrogenase (NADP+)
LGTWKSRNGEAYQAVKVALRVGYRHIDGAWIYRNEDEVGQSIRESVTEGVIQRQEIFVTSKLWNSYHQPQDVETNCQKTLTSLGIDYLDLYLMHWPLAFRPDKMMAEGKEDLIPLSDLPLSITFAAMLKLKDKGLVKSVGVSKLKQLISETGVVPAVNQVEMHPYNPQTELYTYCRDQGIHLTAYAPLGSMDHPEIMRKKNEPLLLENEVVKSTATTKGITPAQLLIAWAIDRGTSTIPKSANPEWIAENIAAGSHLLSTHARQALDELEIRFRFINPEGWFIKGITYEGEDFWA